MYDIYERLKRQHKLNENEKMIVQYLLNHLDEIPYLSSRELARRTYTSSTAIIRFIKKLNYESYNDFKIHIVSDLKNMDNPNPSIMSNEDMLSLVNKISDIEITIIQKTKDMLSMNELNKIISLMNQYQYIDIIANDTNASIGEYASHLFFSVGKIVNVYHHSDKQLLLALNVPQDHIVLMISKYGKNEHMNKVAMLLRKRGIHTIALTTHMDEGLASQCQYSLYGWVEDSFDKLKDTVFYISLKYILDLMYVILFSQNYDNTIQLEKLYDSIFFKKL